MRTLQESGVRVSALDEEPSLYEDLIPAFNVWVRLHNRRSYGFSGPNPLQVTEVLAWLELNGVKEGRDELVEKVFILDDAFMKYAYRSLKKET